MSSSPCLSCGACCAAFRVTFDASELQSEGGCVPDGLADREAAHLARLKGTDHARPRCLALTGQIGVQVRCGIYQERPNPCREFAPLAELGDFSPACNRARARHGLPPLPVD
ncbi:YkgJ family cysteine cluster protein [Chitiniphilus purpureus]|uniref:YkgJ family cysteine cluster protein n=1 Tax=Chitiniphilus purpureus TaxID=2981137 RepID=A0ABY6DHT5_9NEIS|nr:YkgJ family cysteine cluster protein [Chitiniphilus sp. CD1]UXY13788.1 YkgJ family cysteine cluster protein [Chitiniphilus sp. CD1]